MIRKQRFQQKRDEKVEISKGKSRVSRSIGIDFEGKCSEVEIVSYLVGE